MCIAGFDMEKKKLLACSVLCGLIIIGCGLAVIFKDKTEKTPVSEVTEKKIKQEPVKEEIKVTLLPLLNYTSIWILRKV